MVATLRQAIPVLRRLSMRRRIIQLFLLLVALITNSAGVLTEYSSLIEYEIVSVQDSAQWVVQPGNPAASTIQFVFEQFKIRQMELRIYDTQDINSGRVVFNCVSCGDKIPPPFYSRTGSVTIYASAISGVGFTSSSFKLQYTAIPAEDTLQFTNTSVNLNMGYAKIEPFKIGGYVAPNSVQQWAINQNAVSLITFSFGFLNLGDTCSSRLRIYDRAALSPSANLLFDGCRSSDLPLDWLYSTTGQALVIYTTGPVRAQLEVDFQLSYNVDRELFNCGSYVQPDIMSGATSLLGDGSLSSGLMRRGADCTWLIEPVAGAPVSLVIDWVSLKFGASIRVSDGSAGGTLLWGVQGITTTVPPIITSTSKALHVQYLSDTSTSNRHYGFFGEYSSNFLGSKGSGRGFTTLAMSSAIDIFPPGDGITHSTGVNYTWFVEPTTIEGSIYFVFTEMNLNSSTDTVTIYEGTDMEDASSILGVFSGHTLPQDWVITSKPSTSATIRFETTNPAPSPGDNFKISYYADGPNYHCGFTTNPAELLAPSYIVTDGSQAAETLYRNQYCEWNLRPPDAGAVVLYFDRVSLSQGSLRIYRNSVPAGASASNVGSTSSSRLYTEIGGSNAVPAPIVLRDASVGLAYISKSSAVGYGFSLQYFGVPLSSSSPTSASSYHSSNTAFFGDGVADLYSSSVVSLSLPLDSVNTILPGTSLRWNVQPAASNGKIYFAVVSLSLPPSQCNSTFMALYDGIEETAPLLAKFCGDMVANSPYSWIQTSGDSATMKFISDTNETLNGNFEIAYYSDGPNYHCGFAVNPATIAAPSMVFTDGSASSERLYAAQQCEWIIRPTVPSLAALGQEGEVEGGEEENNVVVLEFLRSDLLGAKVEVFDGRNDQAKLLWRCDNCRTPPRTIISSSKTVFVRYTSEDSADEYGYGFQLLYWSLASVDWRETPLIPTAVPSAVPSLAPTLSGSESNNVGEGGGGGGGSGGGSSSNDLEKVSTEQVLELPENMLLTASLKNSSAAFLVEVLGKTSQLAVYPHYSVVAPTTGGDRGGAEAEAAALATSRLNNASYDGRPTAYGVFESLISKEQICGTYIRDLSNFNYRAGGDSTKSGANKERIFLSSRYVHYRTSQRLDAYLKSRAGFKASEYIQGDATDPDLVGLSSVPRDLPDTSRFTVAALCKYRLRTGSTQAIDIDVHRFRKHGGARLVIYGGVAGDDAVVFDSSDYSGSQSVQEQVSAPCGLATVLLYTGTNSSQLTPMVAGRDYSTILHFTKTSGDDGTICRKYSK